MENTTGDPFIGLQRHRNPLDNLSNGGAEAKGFPHRFIGCTAAVSASLCWNQPRIVACLCLATALCSLVLSLNLSSALASWSHSRRQKDIRRRVAERDRRKKLWSQGAVASDTALSCQTSPRFDVEDPAMTAHLEEHGYAVVAAAVELGEVEAAKDLLWAFLEPQANMMRDAPDTWSNANFSAVGDAVNGIVAGNGFGHSRFLWFLRTRPVVKRAFEKIWCTDALIASFDGGNVFRPYHCGTDGRSKRTIGGWWHVDQGREKLGRHAVHGFVSLYDATATTGGLCVVPSSHRCHKDLLSYAAMNENDYVVVPEPGLNPLVRGGKLVACKAGDLVLWDSRTVHCNTPALEPPPTTGDEGGSSPAELLRAVGYVCMTPKRWASRGTLRMRRRAFAAGVGSTHWPHEFKPTASPELLELMSEAKVSQALQDERSPRVSELVG